MSLLDELKAKADERRSDDELEAARLADQAAFYQAELQPRLLKAYSFLKELCDHLKVLDEPCPVSYPLLPDEQHLSLLQENYSVSVDSRQEPTQIELRCHARFADPVEYEIQGKQLVERQRKLLDSYDLKYECTERKDDRFEIESAAFKLIGPMPVKAVIVADSEHRRLNVHLRNFEQAGIKTTALLPTKFDDNFLDQLGRFILRQENNLFTTELSEEARRRLQEKLALQREEEERARRVIEAEREALAKAEYERRPSVRLTRALHAAAKRITPRRDKS